MERSNRIAQAYGYAVCLIAVITILLSAKSITDAAFDLSDPLRAERYGPNGAVTSFEAYKRERDERITRERPVPGPDAASSRLPSYSDEELRRMYDEARAEQMANVRFRSTKSLVSSMLMLLVASLLFFMHWRWLRRQSDTA